MLSLICRVKAPKGEDSLRKKLTQAGYRLEVVSVPEPSVLTTEWVNQNFSAQSKGLLFVDEKLDYVRAVVDRLRGLPAGWRFLPAFYGYQSTKRLAELEADPVAPIADFFALSEPAPRLHLRFQMREAEYSERAAIYRTSQEQATQLAKIDTTLKQREEFLGVCAHDLRSPLGLIQTCLSLVMKSPEASAGLTATGLDLITRAHRQSGHALGLVKDLLDVMALEQGLKPHYQLLNLHELLNEFCSDYRLQAQQKKVEFHYYNPVPDWQVLADSERMKQLLQNLFTNALKFTEPGKNIYLNAAPFQGRRKHDPPHPMIVISLKDEGKGIPQTEMQKIFDRFVQIKEHSREGGRGLGLTVAKQISTLHDGNIWVESEEGKGSTFFVLFPHAISRSNCPHKVSEPRRLLVVEPSPEKRTEIFGRLSEWGYQVDFASDGVEAVTLLFHHWPDALILTPELPKLGAAEVANLVKGHTGSSTIPILLASARNGLQTKRAETILADAILPTPFSQSEWNQAIRSCLPKLRKVA